LRRALCGAALLDVVASPAPARDGGAIMTATTCASCGESVRHCRAAKHKCCPECKCGVAKLARGVRQAVLCLHRTLDLEPLLRGELLAAMAAVLARPELPELDAGAEFCPHVFSWPKEGSPVVHYPAGGHGPRVEHPPGIVCDYCQWRCDELGWPLAAYGRQPRKVCPGCFRLTEWRNWDRGRLRCRECGSRPGEPDFRAMLIGTVPE
jgi:hypothetical protein